MRKFKCVKNYPGADLGTIVQHQLGVFPEYFDIKDAKRYNKKDIENYPEFWQELIEKDYEILELYYNNPKVRQDRTLTYDKNGVCTKCVEFGEDLSISSIIKLNQFTEEDWKYTTILKVKRVSDGEVFQVGDRVNYKYKSNYGNWIIDNFFIREEKDGILARSKSNCICEFIKDLIKVTEPILITEDGVELFEGNDVFFVEVGEYLHHGKEKVNSNKYNYNLDKSFKYFSTKEKALEYIDLNKPRFSKKEVLDALAWIERISMNHTIGYSILYGRSKLGL